jgi:hypothetical protein
MPLHLDVLTELRTRLGERRSAIAPPSPPPRKSSDAILFESLARYRRVVSSIDNFSAPHTQELLESRLAESKVSAPEPIPAGESTGETSTESEDSASPPSGWSFWRLVGY